MQKLPQILYCHCAFAQVISQSVKQKVLEELTAAGVDFEAVPDLCEMSARRDPLLKDIAGQPNLKIAACYPRAVRGLFAAAECPLPVPGPEVVNMRVLTGTRPQRLCWEKVGQCSHHAPRDELGRNSLVVRCKSSRGA